MTKNIFTTTNIYRVGRYQYSSNDIIGSGEFGKVYKGIRTIDKLPVAIKTVDFIQHAEQHEVEFIKNQLKIHQSLKHQRILNCIQIYKKNNIFYFITELIEEGDLEKFISQNGPLTEHQALKLLKQIIDGLLYLKQKKVIHRDIKPQNIFLKDGNTKIADFGLSIFCYQDKIQEYLRIGTPKYMAPQAIRDGIYSFKCDIWSLGIVFIHMITGFPPLQYCSSFEEITRKVIKPIIPKDLKISSQALRLLQHMLQIDFSKRISIQQLVQHPIFTQFFQTNPFLTKSESRYLSIEEISNLPTARQSSDSLLLCNKQNQSIKQSTSLYQIQSMIEKILKIYCTQSPYLIKLKNLKTKLKLKQKIIRKQILPLIEMINKRIVVIEKKTDFESRNESINLNKMKHLLLSFQIEQSS